MTIPDDDNAPSGGDEGDERMTSVEILLPEGLAREIASAGLLDPVRLKRMFERQLSIDRFKAMQEALHGTATPSPMSMDEVQAEIDAYREERRARRSTPWPMLSSQRGSPPLPL